jgi:hypothetical protein
MKLVMEMTVTANLLMMEALGPEVKVAYMFAMAENI